MEGGKPEDLGRDPLSENREREPTTNHTGDASGPFLKSYGSLSGPKPYFEIKIQRLERQVLAP